MYSVNRLWLLAIIGAVLSSCTFPCGKDDPAIGALQGLSQAYYAQLFAQASSVDCKRNCVLPAFEQIRHLATRKIVLHKYQSGHGNAVMKYCFDEGISLRFSGLGSPNGEIYVSWGGSPPSNGEVLLWKSNP